MTKTLIRNIYMCCVSWHHLELATIYIYSSVTFLGFSLTVWLILLKLAILQEGVTLQAIATGSLSFLN
uniref:Uncharacterized protein n=1 Tax=Anguilla anguilla TaxID=7936 RepID=A0A0E9UIW9_ANGAN